ncbi:hypothetical protein Rumeso_02653 [Rubellimicrobium mesophilum DSM 19309]|uniref:Uncharacterized protein n=1 Tax=Rubellimicrobium mesophilum DSM 19309 TaxID=442562 RepID=A0A017HNC0_9RHOB|nr:hypothetical protein [Rubellimicrobium mesophilum]EYD75871.1 hypothetical protein Rumeso_02653 [Rubellimicrobium mesophilum DSM 19309]
MSLVHAHDPHDELDALMREAMGLAPEQALSQVSPEPLRATCPDPFADYGGKVVSFTKRLPEAVLQGFSRQRH